MPRALLVYALVLPLAVLLGYMLATPTDTNSFAVLVMAFGLLCIPFLLKSHHFMLALTWNAALIVFFLPGQPALGTLLAFISLGIAVVTRTMSRQKEFLHVPSVALPLILLTVIVVITAKLTGGIGARVMGAETWGAKRYLGVFGAVVGYFAFTTQRVPREKASLYLGAFFLGGLTAMVSDLTFMAGPQFYFLFVLFPSDNASLQAVTAETLMRLSGLSFAAAWGYYYLIGKYGIEGVFNLQAPWRLFMVMICVVGSLFGGYRGLVIVLVLVFSYQFLVEGVYKSRLGPVLIFAALFVVGGTVAFVDHMPLAVQRAFSFLPLPNIDPTARLDAMGTLDWRLSMWKILIPEVPKYLLLGKGYSFSGTDYYLTQEAVRRGFYSSYEDVLISGNYHNGILTLLIPFGILGFGAFVWFCWSGIRVLINNYKYGDPYIQNTNNFLLSYFLARLTFYVIFYGQFDLDLGHFTALIGLSIAINGGIRRPGQVEAEAHEEAEAMARFQPASRAVAF